MMQSAQHGLIYPTSIPYSVCKSMYLGNYKGFMFNHWKKYLLKIKFLYFSYLNFFCRGGGVILFHTLPKHYKFCFVILNGYIKWDYFHLIFRGSRQCSASSLFHPNIWDAVSRIKQTAKNVLVFQPEMGYQSPSGLRSKSAFPKQLHCAPKATIVLPSHDFGSRSNCGT